MSKLKVGDIVKSYDFVGIDSCYMVGKVIAIRFDGTFRAEFIKRVWQGSIDKKFKTDYFSAPVQGNHFMDNDEMPRVVVVL